jgi:pyridoxine kinase
MASTHNHQKKIALINDFTGFGRCSIAVALPIISTLKVQCCPLPTSIFSNHTGFSSFFMEDFTPHMEQYADEWKKLDLHFSGISTGFLGSADQIRIVRDFIENFKESDTIVIIDPVMGDYGKVYSTYTDEMCSKMKELVCHADILTPNLTEACILTDTPYREDMKVSEVIPMAEALLAQGPSKVVITGLSQKSYVCNLCCEKGKEPSLVKTKRVGTQRSGTGDIFSAIIAADAVNGIPFEISVKRASSFIKKCIASSIALDIPLTDGVCFEEVLHTLSNNSHQKRKN